MDGIIGIIAAGAIFVAALVTGNLAPLCKAIGGEYTPAPPPIETCPGGKFSTVPPKK